MRSSVSILFAGLLFSASCFSQKIRSEHISYYYSKLPSAPLDRSVKNYTAKIDAVYEQKNKQLKADYERALQRADSSYKAELASYPSRLKAADDKYEKELAEYNKKSVGTRVVEKNILGENNKPVKQVLSEPVRQHVPSPVLQTSYDYPVLANTYLQLQGYASGAENAVQLIVTFYGFDFTEPRVLSVQKDMVSVSKGTTTKYKATYYHTEFSYRHPMSVKVIGPGGRELLNLTPQLLNVYKIYRSPESQTVPSNNPELLIKTNEEKILQENLQYIGQLVNDQFGFSKTERKAGIYYVKEKGDTYNDLSLALNEVSSGLRLIYDDSTLAKPKLLRAIDIWKNALKESNPADKKARIDKDVTIAIYFNLLEAYFALSNANAGFDVLRQMNTLSLSAGDRRDRDEMELLFTDLKKRQQVNQSIL